MPKISVTRSTIRPHSADVSIDPENEDVCQIAFWEGEHDVHYVLLTLDGMRRLAEQIERKLRTARERKLNPSNSFGIISMATSVFNDPRFQDEQAAFDYVESKLWPNGPVCAHCGNVDPKRLRKIEGKAHRLGLYQCYECKGQFTVRQGTIFSPRTFLCIFGAMRETG